MPTRVPVRMPVPALVLLLTSWVTVACGNAGTTTHGGNDAGSEAAPRETGAPGEGGSLGTPPLVVQPDANAMAISLRLVKDSDGTTPSATSVVTLMFEPPNAVHLFALDTSSDQALAYNGKYSFSGANLTLSFGESGFSRSGMAAFDPTQPTITLPFQVFSTKAGTSTWSRRVVYVAQNTEDLFEALTTESSMMTLEDRSARILAYAKQYATVHADVAGQALRQGMLAPAKKADLLWFLEPYVTSTYLSSDGTELVLVYSDGTKVSTILYDRAPQSTAVLTMSPLASDPRIDLAITPDKMTAPQSDPPNKTALLIAPFDATQSFDYFEPGSPLTSQWKLYGFHAADNLAGVQSTLEGAGYKVTPILNSDVTVDALVKALSGPAPGFLYFATHGSELGDLATGQSLGTAELTADGMPTTSGLVSRRDAAFAQLRGKYQDLVDWNIGPGEAPLTVGMVCVPRPKGESDVACFLSVRPGFFSWLNATYKTSFDRSLVMIGACRTDQTSDLRDAIAARAYFGYNVSISAAFAGATVQYFAKSLARHSHSAEESYYNVIRVANTSQMIYPEDALYQGIPAMSSSAAMTYSAQSAFKGHFPKGSSTGDYLKQGWLDTPGANPGSIWLLLFAGRWGGDVMQGQMNFQTCWPLWKKGNTGGISAPWCQQASPGYAPHAAELGYAEYLLTGETSASGLPSAPAPVPRFTLHDGP